MSVDFKLVRWRDQDRDDFARLTGALTRVREAALRSDDRLISPVVPQGPEDASDLDRARALLGQHEARRTAAGSNADLFADSAWQILLTLFVGHEEGRKIGSAALALASGSLPATASRWLALLEQRELITRSGGDKDAVRLTEAGQRLVSDCLRLF